MSFVPFQDADAIGDRFLALLSKHKIAPATGSSFEDELLTLTQLIEVMKNPSLAQGAKHIGELNRRAAESEARLKRLYDAIEAGVADLNDLALKDRIDGLKAIRDQAKADAERAQAMLENSGSKAVTPPDGAHLRRNRAAGYPP